MNTNKIRAIEFMPDGSTINYFTNGNMSSTLPDSTTHSNKKLASLFNEIIKHGF